jgi:hypothetical protein
VTVRAASPALPRRKLLAFAVWATASGVLGSLFACSTDAGETGPGGPSPTPGVTLPSCITEIESMRTVGLRYLELHPHTSLADLLSTLDPGRGFSSLELEIREQYARGEIVSVDGWPLAPTELRLYAVVALT